MDIYDIVDIYIKKYKIDDNGKKFIIKTIKPVLSHPEFIRRNSKEYLHHDKTTLAYHIIEDTVLTYKLAKKKKLSNDRIALSLKIAIMHDLYVYPWQNHPEYKSKKFFNKHGFRHPVEAAINGLTWFPNFFKDDNEARIIIDGIIHHMYILPVRSFNLTNIDKTDIKNLKEFYSLEKKYQDMIIESVNRKKIGCVSISKSKYLEGNIMRKADKLSTLDNFSSIRGIVALVTGKNKHIEK